MRGLLSASHRNRISRLMRFLRADNNKKRARGLDLGAPHSSSTFSSSQPGAELPLATHRDGGDAGFIPRPVSAVLGPEVWVNGCGVFHPFSNEPWGGKAHTSTGTSSDPDSRPDSRTRRECASRIIWRVVIGKKKAPDATGQHFQLSTDSLLGSPGGLSVAVLRRARHPVANVAAESGSLGLGYEGE